ncbi:MAG: PD-(D/E)XK nuclease family protein [Pseudomonadota bacterium]
MVTISPENINENTLVITAGKRLSRYLRHQYDQQQKINNKKSWRSLSIMPLETWLKTCWDAAMLDGQTQARVFLNTHQQRYVWQKIISEHSDTSLININNTVKAAIAAKTLLRHYNLAVDDLRSYTNKATQTFITWCDHYKHYQKKYIDMDELADVICNLITKKAIAVPQRVLFYGFLEFTPQQQKLIAALTAIGTTIEYNDTKQQQQTKINQTCAKDSHHEIQHMLRWAKSISQKAAKARVACIVPDLNQKRHDILCHCQTILADQHYNISSGTALIDEPIIKVAMAILALKCQCDTPTSIKNISAMILSPFINGAESELNQRALLDITLRENYYHLQLKEVISHARHCPRLADSCRALRKTIWPKKQRPSHWLTPFNAALSALGWPGERSLNSREYQALQKWQTVLDNFAAMDDVCHAIGAAKALSCLEQITTNTLFQAQDDDHAKIQILGLLEATALSFTHSWVMGLDDRHWPDAANANAFLPYAVQKQLNMPNATPERQLAFSKMMTEHLIQHSQTIVFSYPQCDNDYDLQASALIRDYPTLDNALPLESNQNNSFENNRLEQIHDVKSDKVKMDTIAKGGSGVIKEQAACPFRAFAKYRLQAEAIPQLHLGFDGRQRGIIVHELLQTFWQQTKDWSQLCQLSSQALDQRLTEIIQHVLSKRNFSHLPSSFLAIEAHRLHTLLCKWLTLEKERQPFTVQAEEKKQHIHIGGLEMTIQIDRIDQLEDGSTLIIDYKTGKHNSINDWFDPHPDEPQLPLYACIQLKKPNGIYFAKVNIENPKFIGTAAKKNQCLPDTQAICDLAKGENNWPSQLSYWQNTLTQLAQDFADGDAAVQPKSKQTCDYCDFPSLCRIDNYKS